MPTLDNYDYLTFAALVIILVAGMVVMVFILGLPGRIARKRNHPEADAIYVMGWLGFLGGVPWIQAFMWAFKPTDVVDIRRFPAEERKALAEEFAEAERSSRRRKRRKRKRKSSDAAGAADASADQPSSESSSPETPQSDGTNPNHDTQDQ